jgi:hypothetical protein
MRPAAFVLLAQTMTAALRGDRRPSRRCGIPACSAYRQLTLIVLLHFILAMYSVMSDPPVQNRI